MRQSEFGAFLLSVVTMIVLIPAGARAQAQPAPSTCGAGYVWRQVDPADHVCVTPAQRNQAANENAATGLKKPDGTCIAGYVWRLADLADHVCVTPAQRSQAAEQNAAAASHTLSSASTVAPLVRLPGVPERPMTVHIAANQPFAAISDKAALRLRPAGLDPNAPNFGALLRARLAAVQRIVPIKRMRPLDAFRARYASRIPALLKYGLPGAAGAAPNRNLPQLGHGLSNGGSLQTLQDLGMFDLLSPLTNVTENSVDTITIPGMYLWWLGSSNTTLPAIYDLSATATIDVPACNYSVKLGANFVAGNTVANVTSGYVATILLNNDSSVLLALGATPRSGSIAFQMPAAVPLTSTKYTFAVMASPTDYQVGIGNAPPFISGTNALGLVPSNSTFGQASVTRFNGGSSDMTGDDILGQGIALGAGYTGSATVVSATSVADVNGNSPPDNGYRGASVTIQPQSGRLQTQVHWHISPGDSLQYVVDWTLTGAAGQRAVSTMPLGGPCDS